MKTKKLLRLFLTPGILAMALLGSVGASAATVLITGDDQQIATSILGLDVGGTLYVVAFQSGTADDVYGTAPRTFDFDNETDAAAANDAINVALNANPGSEILLVGGGPLEIATST